ncbi:MAG: GC-type dockerin domain-anchored protein [Phycisphaerales bacterium JB039]
MRRSTRFAVVLAVALPAAAAPAQLWVRQLGTPGDDIAAAMIADGAGGVVVAGTTAGALGGPSAGGTDIWLARYDDGGNQIWITQFGSAADDEAHGMASDGAGGLYLSGGTLGELGGPQLGGGDAWLARCDSLGAVVWIEQIGTVEADAARAVAPDGAGGAFVAGWTYGKIGGLSPRGRDAWVGRYDSAGQRLWITQLRESEANAVAPDGAGGVFVGGYDGIAWLARFDADGVRQWFTSFSTIGCEDHLLGLAPDHAGGVFATGYTYKYPLSCPAGSTGDKADAWITRFDGAGAQRWTDILQSGTDEVAAAISSAPGGSAIIAGWTRGRLAGSGGYTGDAWAAAHSASGQRLWLRQFGGLGADLADAIAADGDGRVYAAGRVRGDFGAPSAGGLDAWIARLADDCAADCNGDGALDFFDFLCFQNFFALADPTADCDGSGELDVMDLLCFQNRFMAGCP